MHHTIEEQHIFPVLALRMPSFKDDEAHIKSHHGIHEGMCLLSSGTRQVLIRIIGLDKLGKLLQRYAEDPTTYSPTEMRQCLDSWREVLFRHLDEEVSLHVCSYQTIA